ncbi:MAG: endonuclease/exonuclease/phosphatase family protein, partial [Candidatus Saccharimonadales bacterium]
MLLFGPRWLALVPALLVLPPVLFQRGGARWCIVGLALVGAGLAMGFNIPAPALLAPSTDGCELRVLTCNLDGAKGSFQKLLRLIRRLRPDVVAIEECSESCVSVFHAEGGWYVEHRGGLLLASRLPLWECQALS